MLRDPSLPRSERVVTLRLPHDQMCTLQRVVLWSRAAAVEAARYLPVRTADTVDQLDEIQKAFTPAFDDAALGRVPDDMVERAARAIWNDVWSSGADPSVQDWDAMVAAGEEPSVVDGVRGEARTILLAAFSTSQPTGENR